MANNTPPPDLEVLDRAQRKALTSPVRLEILGLFVTPEPLSVRDMASMMGRPTTAVYYHVNQLHKVGLLERVGERPGSKKPEALYAVAAENMDLTPDPRDREQQADAVRTMRAAQRMAERDLAAGLEAGTGRYEGPDRNLIAMRMHAALSPASLREVNAHIDAITALFQRHGEPREDDEFCSMTLALLPLPDRRRPA